MDYASNQRQTIINNQSYRKVDLNTTLQNSSSKSQCVLDFNTKSTHWFQNQNRCFIIFWIHKFLQFPSKICSFYAPLSRNNYFKQMSDLISNQLGKQYYKSPSQCKTRFTSIKRKINNEKATKKLQEQFDFIDYVVYQAKKILKQDKYQNKTILQHMIHQIESLRNCESQLMSLTRKILRFQQNWQVEFKNNCIFQYLQQVSASQNK